MEDIIIRNGLIVDVENEKIAKGDISVKDGKIVKICSYIEEHATSEIDADGCYVTPGLIDHHTHIYPLYALDLELRLQWMQEAQAVTIMNSIVAGSEWKSYQLCRISMFAVWVYLHFQSRWKMLNQSTWMWENSKNYLTSTEMNCLA